MMISKEQARAAALELRATGTQSPGPLDADVSPDVVAAALQVVQNTPDTNPERIAEAQTYLAGGTADSRLVASMMIQRIISDSLR